MTSATTSRTRPAGVPAQRSSPKVASLRIGLIGTGRIGTDHIRRLTELTAGAEVVAVSDVDTDRAREVAGGLASGRVTAGAHELIADDDVDAVVVSSWGPTHEEYVLACIAAGKPVFCEKPLATTQDACRRIVEAEVAAARRYVQVGYMRRYDPSYRTLKAVVDSGEIGAPLLVHSGHRNASVPGHYTGAMTITDTAVHDFDVARWLLDEEIAAVTVLTPKRNRGGGGDLPDPLLILLESESGVLVDVEVSVNIRYGYDIRGAVVRETGTVSLADGVPVVVRSGGRVGGPLHKDWQPRFAEAYDAELRDW